MTSATDRGRRPAPRRTPLPPFSVVADPAALDELCDAMAEVPSYALDTEFHTERTYVPHLALIQLAWDGGVAIVDPLALDPAPLGRVFAGPGVAVAHAAGQDLDVLAAACGVSPSRVFDTQIAAGFIGMSTPSLSRLVESVLDVSLPKADRLSDWTQRPIPDRQLEYAVSDVAHLLDLHSVLTKRLQEMGRLEWALDECDEILADRATTRDPEEAWWRLGDIRSMSRRSRGWRRRWLRGVSARRPTPIGRGAPSCPTSASWPSHSAHRTVSRSSGAPAASTGGIWPRGAPPRSSTPFAAGSSFPPIASACRARAVRRPARPAALAVCSGLVRQIADDLDFDQSLLATRADVARLLCGEPGRLDSGWRRRIVGDPLRRLVSGQVAIALTPRSTLVLEERSGRPA